MSTKRKEEKGFVRLLDVYVSAARSVDLANQRLEKGGTGELSYAVVESDISIPYKDIVHTEDEIRLKLPEAGSSTQGLQHIAFKVKPVPRLVPLEKEQEARPTSVPDLTKQPIGEALATVVAKGYRVGKLVYDPRAKPEGVVVSQEPEPGRIAKSGTKIDLHVSGDSLRIEIPPEAVKLRARKPPAKAPKKTARKKR